MTKDEALDLALEALDNLLYWDNGKSDYDQAREAITAIKQARSTPVQEPVAECVWEHEDNDYMPGTWKSGCGVFWTFTDGSPVENDMKYCCGCGAKLKEKNT